MQVATNVLNDITIKEIFERFQNLKTPGNKWNISQFRWSNKLHYGSYGSCVHHLLADPLSTEIECQIKKLLPEYKEFEIQFYVWMKGSAISLHTDGLDRFGATIYLNRDWNIDHGGLFVYKNDEKFNAIVPSFNTMVINNQNEPHMVTHISPLAPEDRYSLQIWGYY
jgi:Rps23 Pro-64 3,4-dihydroxylase Tpa1-like proline 4-hydroxylase